MRLEGKARKAEEQNTVIVALTRNGFVVVWLETLPDFLGD